MTIKIILSNGNPPGKLAEAELHFTEGPLEGLKLIGFAVWERKSGLNVTFPARSYAVNGERRSYALLRPLLENAAQNRLRDLILEAYAEHAAALETATPCPARTDGGPCSVWSLTDTTCEWCSRALEAAAS